MIRKWKIIIISICTLLFIVLANALYSLEVDDHENEYQFETASNEQDEQNYPLTNLDPTPSPSLEPVPSPIIKPSPSPTPSPTIKPSPNPTPSPSPEPSPIPTPSPTPKPSPKPPPPPPEPIPEPSPEPTVTVSGLAGEVINIVNAEREKVGLHSLKNNSAVANAAQVRAEELTVLFSHTRPNGSDCFTALSGIALTAAGENIAYGQTTAQNVMSSWMSSEGHKSNILSADFTEIGIGCYEKGGVIYWVQFFIGT